MGSAIDKGLVNGVVLLDLRKAFDLVNHTIVLDKLAIYGCSQRSMRRFSSYLSDRKQFVLFKGKHTEQSEITTGVPQGSILGPLFFIRNRTVRFLISMGLSFLNTNYGE